jgi:hypothetical protein
MIAAVLATLVALSSVPFADNSSGALVDLDSGTRLAVRMTGFSYHDNTPARSADICCGVVHDEAAGTGTYENPITVAVPGSGRSMEFEPGTVFYAPDLRRYLIVEDSGASRNNRPHLDVYVDGQGYSKSASDKCMREITGTRIVIEDPDPDYPVTRGPLTGPHGCRI